MQYEINEDYTIGAAYEYVNPGNADIEQSVTPLEGRVQGRYQQNSMNVFNLTIIRRF